MQSLIFISNIVPIFFFFVYLLQVAITILWLARAARKRGYQGPVLDSSCFHHLLPVRMVFFLCWSFSASEVFLVQCNRSPNIHPLRLTIADPIQIKNLN